MATDRKHPWQRESGKPALLMIIELFNKITRLTLVYNNRRRLLKYMHVISNAPGDGKIVLLVQPPWPLISHLFGRLHRQESVHRSCQRILAQNALYSSSFLFLSSAASH